jgi:hypothetical protein
MAGILAGPDYAREGSIFRSSLVASCFIVLTLAPTEAQQPTQAQRDAIRAACRSDFMANCASVQPGGKEALDCLLRNEPKLSGPCRSAVNAIATPAPSATAPAAATAPQPSDASTPAQSQSSMQAAAAPPSTKTSRPVTAPTRKSPGATRTTTPAEPTASTAASGSASAPTAAPAVAPLGPIRPMLPRRALMILAQCRPDQQRLCAGVPAGGGKILSCLAANAQQLSPTCYEALARVSE